MTQASRARSARRGTARSPSAPARRSCGAALRRGSPARPRRRRSHALRRRGGRSRSRHGRLGADARPSVAHIHPQRVMSRLLTLIDHAEMRSATDYWWLPFFAGVLSMIVGVIAIFYPGPTLQVVGLLIGIYLALWG